jgi:hypothetical protein
MDNNATALNKALSVLRQHHGEHLDGPQQRTQAQMRQTLQREMSLDEMAADRILTALTSSGRLVYVGGAEPDPIPEDETTGPVISMPLTQTADGGTPLITTASPALVMGIVDGQDQAGPIDTDTEAQPAPRKAGEDPERDAQLEGDLAHGYWHIG